MSNKNETIKDIDHFRMVSKKQWEQIYSKENKITKLKEKLAECKARHAEELEVKDAKIKKLRDRIS